MALSLKAQKKEADKNSMQYRFAEAKKQELGLFKRHDRPFDPWTVTSTVSAEKWRTQVIKEITERVTRIVDERLSEFQIRDKNDEINVLVREKDQWEIRIKELGGPDYKV
jgi:pre-mRNA-splicing factor ISY1